MIVENKSPLCFDESFLLQYFTKIFFNDEQSNFFFSFFGTLFFSKIKDYFFFKTLNQFDLMFFFDNRDFDFIIFNHLHNRIFFFQILNSIYKFRKVSDFFLPVLNHYDFLNEDNPFDSSIYFFSRTFFNQIPPLYESTEKELMFFFDKF